MTTNGPPDTSAATSVLATFDPGLDAWSFTATEAGPAGVDVVHLAAVRLSVDAAEPGRLVEVLVRSGDRGPADPATVALVERLLGPTAARVVARRPAPGPPVRFDARGDNAVLATASALAVAMTAMGTTRLRPARWLRGLDIVLQATRMGAETSALAATAAWEVWPHVVSFARTAREVPGMLGPPRPALAALRSRLLVLLHVVTHDDVTVAETTAHGMVHQLSTALAQDVPRSRATTGPGPTVWPLAANRTQDVLVFKGAEVRWRGAVEDFKDRLGRSFAFFGSGAVEAHGRAPGEVTVSVPLEAGVTTGDLSDVRVRLLTPDAVLLAEAPLEARHAPDILPTAFAHLTLPVGAGSRRLRGVAVDLARSEVPAPDAEALADLARSAGFREGRVANEARRVDTALAHWEESARQFAVAGDDARAARAREYASRAAACVGSLPGPHEGWRDDLADTVSRWSRDSLTEIEGITDPGPRVTALRRHVGRLTPWSDPSVELATARATLGRALRLHTGFAEDPDESARQLREAGRLYLVSGHPDDALACQRELSRRRPRR